MSKRKENNGRGKFQRGISLGGSLATKRIATSITKGVLRFAFYCLFSTSIPLFHLPFSLRPCLLAGRVTLVLGLPWHSHISSSSSSFTICHIFALEINYFPVFLSVRALLARSPKCKERKVVSGSRVTLPSCKQGLKLLILQSPLKSGNKQV